MTIHQDLFCPACSKVLAPISWGSIDGSGPQEGYVSVCQHCATILQFGGLDFKVMTKDEMARLPQETIPLIREVQRVIDKIQGRNNERGD